MRYFNCVPAWRATRKLQALSAIGWDCEELGRRLGISWGRAAQLRRGDGESRDVSLAQKIDALYNELHMIPGPSAVTRSRASRYGWPPPLAWDDIDDPDETPTLDAPADDEPDENVVRAFVQHRPPRWARLTGADKTLLCRELRRRGYTCNAVALATHAGRSAVLRYWDWAA